METSETLQNKLKNIVGDIGILPEGQISDYSIDGIMPKIVVLPETVQELQDVFRIASENNCPVIPAGSGSKLGIGNMPQEVGIVLVTTRLNKVVEYEPADLTVTLQSGIRLSELQTELAKNRQFLAMNPPYADRCTIGGIVSTNVSGPLRLRYGSARNQVLGLQVVHANGTVVKSGGKVVKNVAGYDLNKLYIGAYGTLGIITEVTLKLSPIPLRQAVIAVQFQSIQDAVKVGLGVISSQALPTFVNLSVNHRIDLFLEGKPTLIVGFGGEPETVSWQLSTVQSYMEQNGSNGVQIAEGELYDAISNEIQEFPASESVTDTVIAKVNLKRSDIAQYLEQNLGATYSAMLLLGNGVIYFKIPLGSDNDIQEIAAKQTEMRESASNLGGNLIIESAPPLLKSQLDVWGAVGSTFNLMKLVKSKFDTAAILNPGRFVMGI